MIWGKTYRNVSSWVRASGGRLRVRPVGGTPQSRRTQRGGETNRSWRGQPFWKRWKRQAGWQAKHGTGIRRIRVLPMFLSFSWTTSRPTQLVITLSFDCRVMRSRARGSCLWAFSGGKPKDGSATGKPQGPVSIFEWRFSHVLWVTLQDIHGGSVILGSLYTTLFQALYPLRRTLLAACPHGITRQGCIPVFHLIRRCLTNMAGCNLMANECALVHRSSSRQTERNDWTLLVRRGADLAYQRRQLD